MFVPWTQTHTNIQNYRTAESASANQFDMNLTQMQRREGNVLAYHKAKHKTQNEATHRLHTSLNAIVWIVYERNYGGLFYLSASKLMRPNGLA